MNPPPAQAAPSSQTTVVVRDEPIKSPLAIVITDMLWGGGGGALVGLAVGLIDQEEYARNILIGTGAGMLVGGVVGGIHAYYVHSGNDVVSSRSFARDGLGTLARDRELQRPMTQVAALTWRY